jgi:hypothetical protein
MDGHTVFERGHADEGVVTASETGGLLFLSLCFAWFLLPLRLLASHLNALDLERCPDLGADNNLCIPLGATLDIQFTTLFWLLALWKSTSDLGPRYGHNVASPEI